MKCKKEGCEKDAIRYGKFCSHSCAASHNNIGVRRHGQAIKKCENCEDLVRNPRSRFCCCKCFQVNKRDQYIQRWFRGEESGIRAGGLQVSQTIRNWVKEKSKGHCAVCDQDVWMDRPMPLILDHINGNPLDNRPPNLRMVCGNCDMQLPTYKALNKGKGRKARRLKK